MDKDYCVYIHKNKTNGKVYVGLTNMIPEERWRNGYGYHSNDHFKSAIKQCGWDGFEHIIIADGLTKDEAAQMEIELIAKYNATDREFGYNIQSGGFAQESLPEESKQKISDSLKKYFATHDNPMLGRKQSEESKYKNMMSQETRKEVICYNAETNEVIDVYPSVNAAANAIGISLSSVSACCNGKLSSVKGFKCQFVDEPHEFVPSDYKRTKSVAQIDLNTGEVVQVFESVREAQRVTGINNIAAVARGGTKYKSAGGFKWQYI